MSQAKIELSPQSQMQLTEFFQLLCLSAICAARRWEKGELTFQGGTSLRLTYGSPRFSEDLDFLAAPDISYVGLMNSVVRDMDRRIQLRIPDARVTIGGRGLKEGVETSSGGIEDQNNPRIFTISIMAPQWARSIKIKAEFWLTPRELMANYDSEMIPASIRSKPAPPPPLDLNMQSPGDQIISQIAPMPQRTLIETATVEELLTDKLHAIACRQRLKHRDIYDLWFLDTYQKVSTLHENGIAGIFEDRIADHLKLYSHDPDVEIIRSSLRSVLDELRKPEVVEAGKRDLNRWLSIRSVEEFETNLDAVYEKAIEMIQAVVDGPAPIVRNRPRQRE